MNTYVRLLGFAKPLSRYAVPYFFYSVFHALFNTLTYVMIVPIIGTLFSEGYVFQPVYEFPIAAELKELFNADYLSKIINYF